MAALLFWLGVAFGQDVFTDNVVILLDTSCSMEEKMKGPRSATRMEAAKDALRLVLQQIPDTTAIGLLTFEGSWAVELGHPKPEELAAAIDRPYPSGGTPLGEHLKVAADRLLRAREEQHGYGTYRLLVVTDGEATDQKLLEKYAPEVVGRGIVLDTIGVAMESDHTLKKLAHSYRSADDPDSLTKAVQQVLAEVSTEGTDAAGVDAFAEIDGLPDAFAMALLVQLSEAENHPIGTTKKVKKPGEPLTDEEWLDQQPPPPPADFDCSTGPGPVAFWPLLLPFLLGSSGRRPPGCGGSRLSGSGGCRVGRTVRRR